MAGILSPSRGSIIVNGVNLKSINLNYYRSHIGQSLLEETPFEGTILENITFGDKNISQKEVYWAIEKVGLSAFVREMPQGLQTTIYPEGMQLPFVISKKIVLARSIVRKPSLLLLKDPLDQFNEDEAMRIMDFLTDRNNPWSLVVVSRNPLWAPRCTHHLTMVDGKITNEEIL